MNYAINEFIR